MTFFYGSVIPQNPSNGDVWYRTLKTKTTILKFENGRWI